MSLEDVMREVYSNEDLEVVYDTPLAIPSGSPFPSCRLTWRDRMRDRMRRACWRLGAWLMDR